MNTEYGCERWNFIKASQQLFIKNKQPGFTTRLFDDVSAINYFFLSFAVSGDAIILPGISILGLYMVSICSSPFR